MGTTTNRIFSDATNEMATMLKALGHPARFEIINLLKTEKTCCDTAIMSRIPLAQSLVTKHLKELKNAEIITCENKDNMLRYTLNENAFNKIEFYFKNNTLNENIILSEAKKTPCIQNSIHGAYFSSGSIKPNINLKKENYVFKHLLLKTLTVKN